MTYIFNITMFLYAICWFKLTHSILQHNILRRLIQFLPNLTKITQRNNHSVHASSMYKTKLKFIEIFNKKQQQQQMESFSC